MAEWEIHPNVDSQADGISHDPFEQPVDAYDPFSTDALGEALGASANIPEQNFVGPSGDKDEAKEKAKAAGWTEPKPYDYAVYHVPAKEESQDSQVEPALLPSFEWASDALKYEWTEQEEDQINVGPPHPQLEEELFRSDWLNQRGDLFANIRKIHITVNGPKDGKCPPEVNEFDDMMLHPIVRNSLALSHWTTPTPVQSSVIPIVLAGHDVVAIAQTGTGKTAAYLLPIISKIVPKSHKLCAPRPGIKGCESVVVRAEPLVIIVVPTRELAMQVFDESRRWCYRTMLRPCVVYGGGPISSQIRELQRGCDVLIGTLGRLCDILRRPDVLSLSRVKYNVIDEADELLHEDWETDLQRVLMGGDANPDEATQFLMFSATFPRPLRKIAKCYLDEENHVRIRIGRMNEVHNSQALKQNVVYALDELKDQALYDLLFAREPCRTMVFVNSQRKADLVDDFLYNAGLPSTSIHAGRTQREREDAIRGFRHGHCPILVTTAIAARGLDIKNVLQIVNYDLPSKEHGGIEEYIHRIGRTARIGNQGTVTSFYNDRNADIADDLCKILVDAGEAIPDFLDHCKPEGAVSWEDLDEWDELSDVDANDAGGVAAPFDNPFDAAAEETSTSGNVPVGDAGDHSASGHPDGDSATHGAANAASVVADGGNDGDW